MEPQSYISLASVALAWLIALLGGFRYITAQVEGLRREIDGVKDAARLIVEKSIETESKQRQAGDASVATQLLAAQTEVRQLQREAVRHEQMDQLEGRMHNSLSKIEAKVDKLHEMQGDLTAIKAAVGRLERLFDRSNTKGSEQ